MKSVGAAALILLITMSANATTQTERKADALDARFKHAEALPLYLEALEENPGDSEILRKISKQYGQLIETTSSKSDKEAYATKALDFSKKAVEADPENPNAILAVAISYGKASFLKGPKERLRYARNIKAHAEKALKLSPSNPIANHILGRWHYEVVTMNPAVKFTAKALFGSLPDASLNKAVTLLGKAAKREPDNVLFVAEYGRALAEAGKETEARKQLQRAIQLPAVAPGDGEAQARAKEALRSL